jgi:hypothetical protein
MVLVKVRIDYDFGTFSKIEFRLVFRPWIIRSPPLPLIKSVLSKSIGDKLNGKSNQIIFHKDLNLHLNENSKRQDQVNLFL